MGEVFIVFLFSVSVFLLGVYTCAGVENLVNRRVSIFYGEGVSFGFCLFRRRFRVFILYLSDRYKVESSRMNLVGDRVEKGLGVVVGGSFTGVSGGGGFLSL